MLTIKQLSQLAGVTPRTLRYYDQIGLLKPSQVGQNGYRYYTEEALLRLQQVLFYRELGVPLEEIRRMMGRSDYDILHSLEKHRSEIAKRISRLQTLIQTINHTISHLKGRTPMDDQKIFAGFTPEEEEKYAQEAEQRYDPVTVRESNRRWKAYGKEKQQAILREGQQIYQEMAAALPLGAESATAQALVQRWREHMNYFWTPTLEQLCPLAETYVSDPRFRANFEPLHPQLPEFILAAVRVYVTNQSPN